MKLISLRLFLLFPLSALCFGGGSNSPKGFDDGYKKDVNSVKENVWPKFPCTKKVSSTITVASGKTFDGEGCEYIWTGKYSDKCDAPEEFSEGVPKMFVLGKGSKLKNIGIRCSPDGVELGSNSKLDNVKVRTEEDAVNMSGSVTNVTIRNTNFYYSSDKAFQGNPGIGNVTLYGVGIYHANSPIKYDGDGTFRISNSKFKNFNKAIGAQSSSAHFIIEDTTFEQGNCIFRKDFKAKLTIGKNVKFNGVKEKCD
jgi:hypothetical protein